VFGNVARSRFPRGGHALLTDDSLFANGAAVIKAGEFPETVGVNGVSAGQVLWALARREHVFATDGATVFVLVLEALVRVKDSGRNAHTTFVAVAEGFHAADAAKAAEVAMKRLFGLWYIIHNNNK
jgi:hypothetical protein